MSHQHLPGIIQPDPAAHSEATASEPLREWRVAAALAPLIADPAPAFGGAPQPWKRPAKFSGELRALAATAVPHAQALLEPAPLGKIAEWLSGIVLAANLSAALADDAGLAEDKVAAAVTMLEGGGYPIGVFTAATALVVSRRFKFWPSISELCDALDPMVERLRQQADRLAVLATDPPPAPDPRDRPKRQAPALTVEERLAAIEGLERGPAWGAAIRTLAHALSRNGDLLTDEQQARLDALLAEAGPAPAARRPKPGLTAKPLY